MSKKNYLSLTHVLSKVFFIGIGISNILIYTKQGFIFSIILGTILGSFIISIINNIKFNNKDIIVNIFMFIILYIFFLIGLTIILDFINKSYLINTNRYFILIPLLLTILYMNKNNLDIHLKVANILLYISILLFIISYLLLIPSINYMDFLPIFNISIKKILIGSYKFAIYSSVPNILYSYINYNINNKKIIFNYVFSNIVLLIIMILIIGILGSDIISIFKYPEYIILKNIKLLGFIKNVENIYSIIWIFILIIFLSICSKEMYDIIYIKCNNKYIYPILLFMSTLFLNHFLLSKVIYINWLFNYLWIILTIILLIFYLLKYIKK